jgi:hypothetical protein
MKQCDCHHTTTYTRCDGLKAFMKHECWGTRERDECSCGGDKTKCDFYPDVREKALQEIEPKFGEWISVHDKLPDEDIRVLVSIDSDRSYTKIDTDRILNGNWVRWYKDVTHWMPTPELPKGE